MYTAKIHINCLVFKKNVLNVLHFRSYHFIKHFQEITEYLIWTNNYFNDIITIFHTMKVKKKVTRACHDGKMNYNSIMKDFYIYMYRRILCVRSREKFTWFMSRNYTFMLLFCDIWRLTAPEILGFHMF